MTDGAKIGAVVIGRNEGERLLRCISSLKQQIETVVYVDSGSTDGSVAAAEELGARVVVLDQDLPFTAARARNAGLEGLLAVGPFEFVQFIDGDCELQNDWVATAYAFLSTDETAVVACGRRKERHPDASIYNRLIDAEWDTPVGEAKACGGDALMRVAALTEVGGFDPNLIAGEEPELCVRLRKKGGTIHRLDAPMTLHDAAITRFGQWWQRNRRAGHAYAEGAAIHGAPPEHHNVPQTRRAVLWGLLIPFMNVLSLIVGGWALVTLLILPAQVARLRSRGLDLTQAFFLTLGKIPEGVGVLDYHWRRFRGDRPKLIEYK